jgi:uncharacterized tellurite resistance protein B-like protein
MESFSIIILLIVGYYFVKKRKKIRNDESSSDLKEETKQSLGELRQKLEQQIQELEDKKADINDRIPMDKNLALFTLIYSVAVADGEWSEKEIKHAGKFSVFREALKAIDFKQFLEDLNSRKIIVDDAISFLQTLDRERVIEIMLPIFETAIVGLVVESTNTSDALDIAKDILKRFNNISLQDIMNAREEYLKCTFEMNKDYAFFALVFDMGNSDGIWTSEEQVAALKYPVFSDLIDNIDLELYTDNYLNGRIELMLAIDVMKLQDRKFRLDCMVVCLAIIMEDGKISEEEKGKYFELLSYFDDLTWEEVLEEYLSSKP